MWNYPFDPEEIEGEASESSFGVALMWLVSIYVIAYFGAHFVAYVIH